MVASYEGAQNATVGVLPSTSAGALEESYP